MPTSTTKFIDEQVLMKMSRSPAGTIAARRLVKINADHTKVDQATANDKCHGISEVAGVANDPNIAIACRGHLVLEAGGTIALDDEIVSDANGKGVARGVIATTLYNVVGRAITEAAAGEYFIVDFSPYSVWGANAS